MTIHRWVRFILAGVVVSAVLSVVFASLAAIDLIRGVDRFPSVQAAKDCAQILSGLLWLGAGLALYWHRRTSSHQR